MPDDATLLVPAGGMPIVVLWGLDPLLCALAERELVAGDARQLALYIDPCSSADGMVEVTLGTPGQVHHELRDIEHACASCAVREVVVAILREAAESGRYDRAVVHLHPAMEVDVALGVLHRGVGRWGQVTHVVTVLGATWFEQLTHAVTLAEAGIPAWDADARASASLLAAAIEAADLLMLPTGTDPPVEESAVLAALAPDALAFHGPAALAAAASSTDPLDADRGDPFHPYGLRDPQLSLLPGPHGLSLLRWRTERPLHPARLWDRLDDLAGGIVRSTGHLWFATRPDMVLGWDTAGDALRLGAVARWVLPAPDDPGIDIDISPSAPQRRHAARRVHPYYGDRENAVTFLGEYAAIAAAAAVFEASALHDAELAAGAEDWRGLEDPFPAWRLPDYLFAARESAI